MSKQSRQARSKQVRKMASKRRWGRIIAIISPLLVLAFVGVWWASSRNTICENVQIPDYPPSVVIVTPEERELWRSGYQGSDPVEHFKWIVGAMAQSQLPIFGSSGRFLENNKQFLALEFVQDLKREGNNPNLENPMAIAQRGDKIGVAISSRIYQEMESIQLAFGIAHESTHIRELIQSGVAKGFSRGASDPEFVLCGEMRAVAVEVAAYSQLHQNGYNNRNYQEDLEVLESLDWKWRTEAWKDYVRKVFGY